MPTNVKAMIVVLLIAATTFRFTRPVAVLFCHERDFARRRNVWFGLTITAFLSPSFWIFAAVAILLLIWAGRRDTNPAALYVQFLHVIPPFGFQIPAIGVNELFALDMYRLLSFCVLLPAAWRLRHTNSESGRPRVNSMEFLLLAFGVIQILFYVHPDTLNAAYLHDSVTNTLRRAFLFFIDVYLVYFVVSRSCSSRRAIADVLASFCLACAVMAPLAVFEALRHWLLYAEILGWSGEGLYLERGGVLRAAVSAGHPLALGYLLAIGLGFWLYLRTLVVRPWLRLGGTVVLCLGLLSAYSRGPWIGALLIYVVFVVLGKRLAPGQVKAAVISALLAGLILLSPWGDRVTRVMPLMGGTVDAEAIDYRRHLAERSLEMIWRNPWFGDQDAYSKMQDLRQGQGIIDFVDTYAAVAVFYGLVGLFLFVGFILVGLFKTYRLVTITAACDSEFSLLGVSLVACILGTLLMISACSFIFAYEKMFYVLGGLAAAYAQSGLPLRSAAAGVRITR